MDLGTLPEDPELTSAIHRLEDLTGSWQITLAARRLSPNTLACYGLGVKMFLRWCREHNRVPDMTRPDVARAFLADIATRQAASTVYNRYQGLRSFGEWLAKEDEITADGMTKVDRPQLDSKAPPIITVAQRDAMIAAAAGTRFTQIRDRALLALLFDSMLRAREMTGLRWNPRDVDLKEGTVHVVKGKGRKERWSSFELDTAALLDKYERKRKAHRLAGADAYWLGIRGPLTYDGLAHVVKSRARLAGLDPREIHAHMFRGGGAVDWRRRGGSIEGLMELGGWSGVEMPNHYTRVANRELALAEAKQLRARTAR